MVKKYAKNVNVESYKICDDFAKNEDGVFYYAKTKLNRQIYPRTYFRDEFYLQLQNHDILAINEEGNTYYANSKDHIEILPKKLGKEYYLKDNNGNEIYPKDNKMNEYVIVFENNPMYALNSKLEIVYPIDSDSNSFYHKTDKKEIYGKDKNEIEQYIFNKTLNKQIYAKDNGNEYAAKNKNLLYYAWKTNNKNERIEYCPKRADGTEIFLNDYPKNINTDQYEYPSKYTVIDKTEIYFGDPAIKQLFVVDKTNDTPIYAKNKDGNEYLPQKLNEYHYISYKHKEYYPKLKSTKQFYLKKGQKEIYAKNNKNEYYGQDENKNDFLACDNEISYYAEIYNKISSTEYSKKEIYPKYSNNCEFYRVRNKKEICALINKSKFYYAKNEQLDEFYPKNLEN
ncbi:hypothetical protein NPIL_172951 [Nephila pilipes]|uniref:Uncharacterized protein n=1 Tax=Nephila pilipes TaxID=299642 RepID=A0A8X6TCZ1_NEPPI|nr:hypothetical protein NPIL_172951 [Nephila pilipes]